MTLKNLHFLTKTLYIDINKDIYCNIKLQDNIFYVNNVFITQQYKILIRFRTFMIKI